MPIIPKPGIPTRFLSKKLLATKPIRRSLIVGRLDRVSKRISNESFAVYNAFYELSDKVRNSKISSAQAHEEIKAVLAQRDKLMADITKFSKFAKMHFTKFDSTSFRKSHSLNPVEARIHFAGKKLNYDEFQQYLQKVLRPNLVKLEERERAKEGTE